MKPFVIILYASLLLQSSASVAQDRSSIGLQIGKFANEGVSYQYLLGDNSALHANASLKWGTLGIGVDWVHFFSDHDLASYSSMRGSWSPYMGIGLQGGWYAGIRGLAGIQYGFEDHPLNFYFSFVLLPNDLDKSYLGGMLGIRYQL